ncbi:MAG: alpha/beta hydrolase [Pseudomonadota bacterium]|nr:alpha/beta hydrolase [Pseudomonadota bacterium]
MRTTLLICILLSTPAWAATCNQSAFTPNAIHQKRLEQGWVGQWNRSFAESIISIQDIDGNTWDYYAIEKKPDNARHLILFLHGFPEFAYAWEQQLEYFGERHHAVAIDLKGHHYSSSPDAIEEYDFIEIGWEIRALIRCLGYDSATLVGHDFGGAIAWIMGMLHPDAVDGLVVLNVPHPYLFGRALLDPNSDQASRSRYVDYAQGTGLKDQLNFSKVIFSDFSIFESGFYSGQRILRLMLENWVPTERWKTMKHYYRAMPYPPNEQDYPAELTPFQRKIYSVKRPTLFLWGLADPYFAPDTLNGIEDLVPDLELVTYPNGSHWLHHEAEDLNLRIDAFLNRIHP